MKRSAEPLLVFLDAVRQEAEALEGLAYPLTRTKAYDQVYETLMDAYAMLRNVRTDALGELGYLRVQRLEGAPAGEQPSGEAGRGA